MKLTPGGASFKIFATQVRLLKNSRCQFHQRYTRAFFVRTSFSLVTCMLPKRHSYEKFGRKTLMKLIPCGLQVDRPDRNFGRNRNRTEKRIHNFEPKPEPKADLNRNRNQVSSFTTSCVLLKTFCLTIFCGWPMLRFPHFFWKRCKNKFSKSKNLFWYKPKKVNYVWTKIPAGTDSNFGRSLVERVVQLKGLHGLLCGLFNSSPLDLVWSISATFYARIFCTKVF